MHATVLDAAPLPLRRPTVSLTLKGYAVLALVREQDALPAADTAAREWIEQQISALLDVD